MEDYYFNERLMRDYYCPSKKETAAGIGISHFINCKHATAFVVLLRSFQYKSETKPHLDDIRHAKAADLKL